MFKEGAFNRALLSLAAVFSVVGVALVVLGLLVGIAQAATVHDAATFDAAANFGNPTAFQEDTARPFVPDGTAEFGWGNALLATLRALADILLPIIGAAFLALIARVTGKTVEADDAARYREYLRSAYNFGLNAVAGVAPGMKLTVTQASPVVEWVLWYAEQLYPQLLAKFGGKEAARLRVWSLVDLAEDEAIPLAPPEVRVLAGVPPKDGVGIRTAPATPAPAPATP